MNKKISDLRREYVRGGLIESDLPDNPMKLFREWFTEALETEVTEPNAMSLATADRDGYPAVRTVLLKEIEDKGIRFFTNYNSDKAADMEYKPHVACGFWWAELERQIRIKGPARKLPEDINIKYFETRPRESQIGAWASDQSSKVESRDELVTQFKKFKKQFDGKEIPKPPNWGGFSVQIESIEFWQGRPGRLHDRILYTDENSKWKMERLAP